VEQALKCQVSSATITSRQLDQRYDERGAKHASVPLRRVRAGEVRGEDFLYELKAALGRQTARRVDLAGRKLRPSWLAINRRSSPNSTSFSKAG
jgi:hypothetical protein